MSLPPARIIDTRYGTGTAKAAIAAHGTRYFTVLGRGRLPRSGVGAVSLKLTATGATAAGYLTAYPSGSGRPDTSTLNFATGRTVANLAVLRVGTNGSVAIYNGSTAAVQLIIDTSGYYVAGDPSRPGMLSPADPVRVLDTRSGLGARRSQVAGHGAIEMRLLGVGGVPSSRVGAVLLNVTATRSGSSGYVSVYPAGASRPTTSVITFTSGLTAADLVVAPIGERGAVTLYNGSAAPVDLLADVVGYYRAGTPVAGGGFGTLGPARTLDTRSGPGARPVAAHRDISFDPLAGTGASSGGLGAVLITVTLTRVQGSGPVSAYADGAARPDTSETFVVSGRTVSVAVVVPVGSDGRIRIYNGSSGALDIIADVSGYFLSADIPAVNWHDVSCVSTSFCLAVSAMEADAPYHSYYTLYDGHSWSRSEQMPAFARYVHCFAANDCLAVGYAQWTRFDGTTWSTPVAFPHQIPVPELQDEYRFACAGPTLCLIDGYDREGQDYPPLRFDGTAWSDAPDPGFIIDALACGATTCTATGPVTSRFDGTSWSAPQPLPLSVFALSCPSSECVAIGSTETLDTSWSRLDATGWTSPAPIGGFLTLAALSCTATTSCTAVGYYYSDTEYPTMLTSDFTGTGWTTPTNVGEYGDGNEAAISCVSPDFCAAVGGDNAVLVRNGSWLVVPVF